MRYSLGFISLLILSSALGLAPPTVDLSGDPLAATAPSTQPGKDAPTTQPRRDRTERQPATRPTSEPASQPASAPITSQAATAPSTQPATQPTTQPANKPKEHFLAIVGGILHPVSGPEMRGATILCKESRIQAIGRHIKLPEGTEILDASGMHVYPGLIAANTRGIVGSEPPEDTTNIYSTNLRLANAAGLTTVVTGNTAAKVSFGSLDGIVLRKNLFIKLRYRSASDRRKLREALEKVRNYLRDKEAYDREKARRAARAGDTDKSEKTDSEPELKEPEERAIKGGNEKYLKLIKREKAAIIRADNRSGLTAICELVRDFDIRVVIQGAMEGWTIPSRLGRAGIKAIVSPRRQSNRDERKNLAHGGSIENAGTLYEYGVEVAVTPSSTGISLMGLAGRDLMNLPMEAAYAVRGGLPETAALESITLTAARILGIDDRVGSIDVGKDADLIVCDGKLLNFFTTVQWTVVNGQIVYDKAAESLFADIRPRTPTTQPAKFKFWPRPFKRPSITTQDADKP